MPLLDASFLQRLQRLALGSRRRAASVQQGERRSPRRGHSQEFADHRPYVPGDDLRFLDWHLYARLDTLWVKLFEEEADRTVQILVDTSSSMDGEKLEQARRVAAALGAVALYRNDRVAVGALTDKLESATPPRRGRQGLHPLFVALEALQPAGGTDLSRAVADWPRHRGAGIALLLTDFLHPDGPEPVLRRLIGRGLEVHAFHVIAPGEIRPVLDGDLTLVDHETGEELTLSVDDRALAAYEARARAWMEQVATICRGLGVGYARVRTDLPVEDVILADLRRLGLVT